MEIHQLDIRKKKLEDIIRKGNIGTLIHMGIMHDPRMSRDDHHTFNVMGTRNVLQACARFGVKKVVILSSANVYGPSPDNSNFLTEDAPLMASQRFSDVRDLIEVDMYAQNFIWRHPEVETVILRPVHIVGPHIKNAPSNYLRLPRPLTIAGFDPMIQLIHVEDVCRALALAMRPGIRGVYNIVGPGEVPLSSIFRELGASPMPVPHPFVRPLLNRLFKLHLTNFPPEELDHIQFLCAVDGSAAQREMSWAPARTLRETIRAVVPE
jgi:UDP-glucose 4-epimerase